MVLPPGNEGSDGPEHTSPLPPVAPAGSARGASGAGEVPDRQLDGAWRLWERLRAFDRRYAPYVDIALAAALFVLCSGWLTEAGGATPTCGWSPR